MATQDEGTTTDPADLSDDAIEALQQQVDGEVEGTDPPVTEDEDKDKDANAGAAQAAAAPAATPEPTPQPTAAPAAAQDAGADKAKIEGVQSKDGSRVLPYSALQAERRAARAAAARAETAERELEQAKQHIADLKAGKNPEGDALTEEKVAEMEADFPAEGKKLRAAFNRIQELEAKVPKAPPPSESADDPATKTQELIDQVPLLLEWQHNDREKFERAIELDAVTLKSPKWKGKDALDRFEHVTRMVAEEYDVPYEKPKASSPTAAPAPKAAPAAPAAAPPEPQRRTPETLSDFKTGTTPDHGSLDMARKSAPALLNDFMGMSDEDIDRQLAKLG